MNITVLCNRDIASNYALNLLLPELGQHQVCVYYSARVGNTDNKPAALKQLAFIEQTLFNDIVSPALNKTASANDRYKTFEQLSAYTITPITELNNINSPKGIATLNENKPDLIISIRYGGILKDAVIDLPGLGVINLHSGKLPQYRGVMASFWAMLNGEQTLGTTLHTISDSSIDTGEVIATNELAIIPEHSYLWHVLKLYENSIQDVLQAILLLADEQSLTSSRQSGKVSYYSFPTDKDLMLFEDNGYSLINCDEIVEFLQDHY